MYTLHTYICIYTLIFVYSIHETAVLSQLQAGEGSFHTCVEISHTDTLIARSSTLTELSAGSRAHTLVRFNGGFYAVLDSPQAGE